MRAVDQKLMNDLVWPNTAYTLVLGMTLTPFSFLSLFMLLLLFLFSSHTNTLQIWKKYIGLYIRTIH